MKATLEFNLPEEQEEYETANKANLYKAALSDCLQKLREDYKYGNHKALVTSYIEETRARLYEIIQEYNIGDDF